MAQKIENIQKKISLGKKTPTTKPLVAILLFTFGVLWLVALIDYVPRQSIYVTSNPLPNKIGWLGAMLSFWSLYMAGAMAWVLPTLCFFIAYKFFFKQLYPLNTWKWASLVCFIVMTCSLMTSYQHAFGARSSWSSNYFSYGWGGFLGDFLFSRALSPMLGLVGSFLFLIPFDTLALLLFFCPPNNPRESGEWLLTKMRWLYGQLHRYWLYKKEQKAAKALAASKAVMAAKALPSLKAKPPAEPEPPAPAVLKPKTEDPAQELSLRAILQQTQGLRNTPEVAAKTIKKETASLAQAENISLKGGVSEVLDPQKTVEGPAALEAVHFEENNPSQLSPTQAIEALDVVADSQPVDLASPPRPAALPVSEPKAPVGLQPIKVIAEEKVEKALLSHQHKGNYQFPPIDLLSEDKVESVASTEDHQSTMDSLVMTLKQFGIEVSPSEVYAGPVITRYEVIPAPGVRVEKIANLEKNIAMALRAISVRIIAPVPGKGCVGIEIPNAHPEPVCLRQIIESKAWAEAKAEIPLVLGKEVTGKPLVADLVKMPHLLIAGATGAGKTVCINAIIASLVYHGSPADIRFLMVDPKIVEMQMYNSLPHMLIPVVTDPKKVPNALKWLISEMEKRYKIFAKVGVRNIAGFNAKVLKDKEEREKAKALDAVLSPEERNALSTLDTDEAIDIPQQKMPYIVCIIDELADLMMVAPADIETCIARLAQLARAAGIHLIIATQRPSVNVITGVIKANLPSRIAFKVPSKVDSRTILDGNGADTLIGRGDMLLIPPGSSSPIRAQGAYVSDDEIQGIVDYLKINGPPLFESSIQETLEGSEEGEELGGEEEWEDAIVPKAIEIIRNAKKPSASLLQRRLRIGYNRAARIMDLLEEQGYLSREQQSLQDVNEDV